MNIRLLNHYYDHRDPLSVLWKSPESISPDEVKIGTDHKTVIVLDHSPNFVTSSNFKIEISLRDSTSNQMRVITKIEKSLWTCAVESALEFHRIVDEIFPDGVRLLRFVVSDFVGRFLVTKWGTKLIPVEQLLKAFASCGIPDAKADLSSCSIINGISMAVEAISEQTELQKKYIENYQQASDHSSEEQKSETEEKRNSKFDLKYDPIIQKKQEAISLLDFIIFGTTEETRTEGVENEKNDGSDEDIYMLTKHITEDIISRNKIVKALDGDKNFVAISHINVYFIIFYPVIVGGGKKSCLPSAKPLTKVNEYVSCSVVCAEAGPSLHAVIHGVILKHYDLASTTVTGIPMKEEAQQGQSVNYDVEVFHPRRSHIFLDKMGLIGENINKLKTEVAFGNYATIRLAWTTPSAKNRWNQFPRCVAALPISPVSVNSRPSVCLTSFLLSGRNVMLEVHKANVPPDLNIQPNVNQKLITNLLICHAGRIYIHTIQIGSQSMTDGTKLEKSAIMPKPKTPVRVADFSTLIQECQLGPPIECTDDSCAPVSDSVVDNFEARRQLLRLTRYWPIKLNEAFIYNIPMKFDPLLSLIRFSELSDIDLQKCKECIHSFIGFKDSKEPLTAKAIKCAKFKIPLSKEEQYQVACEELSNHLHNYINHSTRHLEVFNLLIQVSGLDRTTNFSLEDVIIGQKSEETKTTKIVANKTSQSESLQSNSRSGSPVVKKGRKGINTWASNEVQNLHHFFLECYHNRQMSKWKEFVGREKAGNKIAVLYPNLELNKVQAKGDSEPI